MTRLRTSFILQLMKGQNRMRKTLLVTACLCLILPGLAMAQMNRFNNGFDLAEISSPSGDPEANHGWLYVKDVGSASTLYFENDAGVATAFTSTSPTTDWIFEGATADAYEAVIRATDPTSDTIFIMPVMAAGSYAFFVSTLATNGLDIANSVWGGTNQLVMEGATANAHELIMTPTDPTADRTITWADASGVPILSAAVPDGAHAISCGNSTIVFEGTTADAHETTLTVTDPTADCNWVLPAAAAASYTIMGSTLATNAPDVANSVTGASNALVFEGTADAHEVSLAAADATGDVTVTIPARTGTITLDTKTVGNYADEASPVTVTCGSVYTNADADGACIFNLPEASTVIGQSVTFVVAAAQNLDINPDDADLILLATNAAGDAMRCATAGSTVTLTAVSAVNWVQTALVGTWSDVN